MSSGKARIAPPMPTRRLPETDAPVTFQCVQDPPWWICSQPRCRSCRWSPRGIVSAYHVARYNPWCRFHAESANRETTADRRLRLDPRSPLLENGNGQP